MIPLIPISNAQESAAEAVTDEIAKDPVGFFGAIVGIWQSLVNEVVPAFSRLWHALQSFWWLVKSFLADWIGDPLLRYFNYDTYEVTNDGATNILQEMNDAFWRFFIG